MKSKPVIAIAALLAGFVNQGWAPPPLTTFTYQGRLAEAGAPVNGLYDFRLAVFNDETLGDLVGLRVDVFSVPVSNGLFTVECDPGEGVFDGSPRWLQIAVRTNGGSLTALSPRQRLTVTPQASYALLAGQAGTLQGSLPAGQIAGTLSDAQLPANLARLNGPNAFSGTNTFAGVTLATNVNNILVGVFTGNGAGLANLSTAQFAEAVVTNGQGGVSLTGTFIGNGNGMSNLNAAQLASGTVPDARLAANLARTNQVWLLAGNAGTTAGLNFLGTTDNQPMEFKVNGQRALRLEPNTITPNVIGGHDANVVSNGIFGAFIGGGGGYLFPNRVSGNYAAVPGGVANTASGAAAVAMGSHTTASGDFSSAMGSSAIASGVESMAMGRSTTASGYNSTALGILTVASGDDSTAMGRSSKATGIGSIAMGSSVVASGRDSVAMGSLSATTNSYTMATGRRAKAIHQGAFVWADSQDADHASTANNQFLIRALGGVGIGTASPAYPLTVQGGADVISWRNGSYELGRLGVSAYDANSGWLGLKNASGNWINYLDSAGVSYFNGGNVGIGTTNPASKLVVQADDADVDVEANQFLIRGNASTAKQLEIGYKTSGNYATIQAIEQSVAFRPLILQPAGGNVGIGKTTPASALDVNGTVTATAFNPPSDRNLKEKFTPVDPAEVLEKVAALPVSRWSFKTDASVQHVGPMAQDFHAAFGVGADDRHIATVDADGVALAAIQGLNEKVESGKQKAESRMERLEAENAALKRELSELKDLVDALIHKPSGGGR